MNPFLTAAQRGVEERLENAEAAILKGKVAGAQSGFMLTVREVEAADNRCQTKCFPGRSSAKELQ